jgi:hypothetical protein
MPPKELPLDDLNFSDIIGQNLLYADKTRYIYDLLKGPKKSFFLSRPRRFGKTLLLRTINELFAGNPELFKDLWIGRSDYTFPEHPVLSLSLSMSSANPEILKTNLLSDLRSIAQGAHVTEKVIGDSPDIYFGNLIRALSEDPKTKTATKNKVVLLIDEYDAPVTRNMANLVVAEANAEILRDFFAALKKPNVSPYIRFTLVTGITRYALTSMDSSANHLNDISLEPEYAGLCGFTLEEFDALFADRLEAALSSLKDKGAMEPDANVDDLKSEILHWYDGYNWGGQARVLNP